MAAALEEVRQSDTLTTLLAAQGRVSRWRSRKLWAPAGVIGAALLMAAVWWTQSRATRVRGTPHLTRITYDDGFTTDPAVSPDGKFLAYASDRGGEVLDIWIQPISGGEPTRLTIIPPTIVSLRFPPMVPQSPFGRSGRAEAFT